jgi:hypothetical protein
VVDVVRRVGLRRVPVVTAVVWALAVAVNVVQLAAASLGLLPTLERTPAELHGQWWRIGTALFVQDGGVPGTVSNLAFLAVLGALTEQVLSPPRWLLQYFGAGLAGVLVMAVGRGDVRLPAYAAPAVLFWCGALLGTLAPVLVVPAVVAGALAMRLATTPVAARRRPGRCGRRPGGAGHRGPARGPRRPRRRTGGRCGPRRVDVPPSPRASGPADLTARSSAHCLDWDGPRWVLPPVGRAA